MILSFIKRYKKDNLSQEKWFVRDFSADTFSQINENPLQKSVLLISNCNKDYKCYCPVHHKWEPVEASDVAECLKSKESFHHIKTKSCNLEGYCFNYIKKSKMYKEFGYYYEVPQSELYKSIEHKTKSIEELSPEDLKKYLQEYKQNQKTLENNKIIEQQVNERQQNRKKNEMLHNDVIFYHILFDNKSLVLTLEQYSINSLKVNGDFPYVLEKPSQVSFLKNVEEFNLKDGSNRIVSNQSQSHKLYDCTGYISSFYYVKEIYDYCEALIKNQVCELLNKKINFIKYEPVNFLSKDKSRKYYTYEESFFHNQTELLKDKLCALNAFPYEPALYFTLKSDNKNYDLDSIIKNKTYRNDSNCYRNFCEAEGIKSNKILRRLFLQNPETLLAAKILQECGLKDENIFNSILMIPNIYSNLEANKRYLIFFLNWAIPLKGEKAAWNLIRKGQKDLKDSLIMFHRYFDMLNYDVRRSILKDGFTTYNHDLLTKIGLREKNKNVDFEYTDKELSLQDEIKGYTFKFPKDYYELVEVASHLHNCAASYLNRILDKETLVMYAAKDGEYKLCIEVRQNIVKQQRSDRNGSPNAEELKALDIWRKNHDLVFHGNHW